MPLDKALGIPEDGGALGGCDLATAQSISKVVEIQYVIAISTGRYEKVGVEVMDDKSSLSAFDVDQVDVPPALHRAFEHNRPGQLDALVKQQIAAIDGRPSSHLILGQDPYVVRDNLSDPATGTPLPRAMKDPNVLDGRRCGHLATLS